MMFPTLVDCGDKFRQYMKRFSSDEAVDIKEILARLTTDIIGSCAFGIECNSLEDPDAEFRKYGKLTFRFDFVDHLRIFAMLSIPRNILRVLRFSITKKEVADFFMRVVHETVDYREKNGISRKDFMQLLIQLKNQGKESITMNELAAQAFVFYLAGFETSSTVMTFALYELSVNQDIQEKAREEIRSVLKKYDDKVTYEGVMEMSYLGKVLDGI